MMKNEYVRPVLAEYGQMTELTLGTGSDKPDIGGQTPSNCKNSDPSVIACVIS